MEYDLTELRDDFIPYLRENGFLVASSLPHIRELELRPIAEIASRFAAIRLTALWVCVPEEQLAADKIRDWAKRNTIEEYFSEQEKEIWELGREEAQDQHQATIGWKFEGALALAWILGCEDADLSISGEMIEGEMIHKLFVEFAPGMETDLSEWIAGLTPQDEKSVVACEDLHYCVLNAGRSAMIGRPDCCPDWWDPTVSTGVIQERRHGLTWALSPGCRWDDTDVSS